MTDKKKSLGLGMRRVILFGGTALIASLVAFYATSGRIKEMTFSEMFGDTERFDLSLKEVTQQSLDPQVIAKGEAEGSVAGQVSFWMAVEIEPSKDAVYVFVLDPDVVSDTFWLYRVDAQTGHIVAKCLWSSFQPKV